MNGKMLKRMTFGKGFIAALDQSGGSTPIALAGYGIDKSQYQSEEEMFDLVHQMRTRVMTSKSFSSDHILGAILFEMTMERTVEGLKTAEYLWNVKGIIPFLKIDQGLAEEHDNVRLMKKIPEIDSLLERAKGCGIFGTKERSVILGANEAGIEQLVSQQFELGKKVISFGLVPIIEPEVDINIPDKGEAEKLLKASIKNHLSRLEDDDRIMLKLTIPSTDNFYSDLLEDKHIVRIVALSGGYSQEKANAEIAKNCGIIASFSRALLEDLQATMTDREFDEKLGASVKAIYEASIK